MPECLACHSGKTVKNGKAKNGTQTYLCKACGRRFHPDAQPVAHSEVTQQKVLAALHERVSVLDIQRLRGVHRLTITRQTKKGLSQ